jgi:prepilin-type N-terminal cleavage/methylation domain-containing protein
MSGLLQRGPAGAQRGFTLIELMLAIIVITIGVLGITTGMATMIRQQDATASRADMAALADSKFEDLRNFAGAAARTADTLQLVPGGSLTVATANYNDAVTLGGRTYLRRWLVVAGVGGTRQVTLRIEPQVVTRGSPVARDFVTLITM